MARPTAADRAANAARTAAIAMNRPELGENAIIKIMKDLGQSFRRQEMLNVIRDARGAEKKPDAGKYTPTKFKAPEPGVRRPPPKTPGTGPVNVWRQTPKGGWMLAMTVDFKDLPPLREDEQASQQLGPPHRWRS